MDWNEYRREVRDGIDEYEKWSPDVAAGLDMVSASAQKTGKLDPKIRSLSALAVWR